MMVMTNDAAKYWSHVVTRHTPLAPPLSLLTIVLIVLSFLSFMWNLWQHFTFSLSNIPKAPDLPMWSVILIVVFLLALFIGVICLYFHCKKKCKKKKMEKNRMLFQATQKSYAYPEQVSAILRYKIVEYLNFMTPLLHCATCVSISCRW